MATLVSRFTRKVLPSALIIASPAVASYYYCNKNNEQSKFSTSMLSNIANSLSIVSFSEAQVQQQNLKKNDQQSEKSIFQSLENHPAGKYNEKLPIITADQIRKSKLNKEKPIYVTFRDGVYDISEFTNNHPGGDQILLAAGGALEQYWIMYPQHANSIVLDLLEELRVGNLKKDNQWIKEYDNNNNNNIKNSAYLNDPKRNSNLIIQSNEPYTAETPPITLIDSHYTPNDLFYVRNHMPVPVINNNDYELNIFDQNNHLLKSFDLDELKSSKFEKVSVSATVQCAGNRRNELGRIKKVKGGGWEIGAISNAKWTGVKLIDVIKDAFLKDNNTITTINDIGNHICFEGLDKDPVTGVVYSTSIPMDIVKKHLDNIILAYEMNDEILPRDHGYPIRIIIPGIVGARHVKWLGNIRLSKTESTSHWQKKDYKSFSPNIDWNNVNFDDAPSIHEMPVFSTICTHHIDDENNNIHLKGYAWSGDGKEIIRVDVSIDGGKNWSSANLLSDDVHFNKDAKNKKRNETYDWKIWSADFKIPNNIDKSNIQLVCKAIDSAYNSQPDGAANVWNLRGLLNNCWHRVDVLFSSDDRKNVE